MKKSVVYMVLMLISAAARAEVKWVKLNPHNVRCDYTRRSIVTGEPKDFGFLDSAVIVYTYGNNSPISAGKGLQKCDFAVAQGLAANRDIFVSENGDIEVDDGFYIRKNECGK